MNPLEMELAPSRTAGTSPVDWSAWVPTEAATLMFVFDDAGRVLLIHKKRGMGAGLINGPGGRLEPGETPLQAAVRETQEELRVTALDPEFRGTLQFDMGDGYNLLGFVFAANRHAGIPTETDEATPEWFPADALPLDRMWEDDRVWTPWMLQRRRFLGRFSFLRDRLRWYSIDDDFGPDPSGVPRP